VTVRRSTSTGTRADGAVERVRVAGYAWAEREDSVVLVRIAPHEMGAGLWTLPGGGLDFGEDPAVGVLRELREETGLDGRVDALLGVRSAMLQPDQTKSGHRIQNLGILYRVAVTGGELRNEVDESTDLAAWVPFAEIDELPAVPLLAWARSLVGR
jgi:ADP-ribose pyrophosphatase YjhB (NUDIX family)